MGSNMTSLLQSKGFEVGILTRSIKNIAGIKEFLWDIDKQQIDKNALTWADHIIHLAGENVGQRWTSATKERIINSRVNSTKLLADALASGEYEVKSFVSASATGFYGDTGDVEVDETAPAGTGFLADVVVSWEGAVDQLKPVVDRLVKLRIGIVLTPEGGALAKMTMPIRLGIGSPLGSGNQWMSWIDLDDLCRMFVFAIENPLSGTYNAVSPQPVTNREMTKALALQLNRPLLMPNVPAFVLKMTLGEMSSMVLEGNKVSSVAIQEEGFKFEFDTLDKSLGHLF